MQTILCQDPTTNPLIREASHLWQLVAVYHAAKGQLNNNLRDYFDSLEDLRSFHAGVVREFLNRTQRKLGNCDNLVLKEPHLTQFFPELFELVPESRFLVILRDPRDAIASMIEVGRKQVALGEDYIFAARNIPQLCQHFKSFYLPAFGCANQQFQQNLTAFRYEHLVQRPQELIEHLRQFTGLKLECFDPKEEPNTGRVDYRHSASDRMYQPWLTNLYGKQISDARIGSYRTCLSAQEIQQVESCCSEFLEY